MKYRQGHNRISIGGSQLKCHFELTFFRLTFTQFPSGLQVLQPLWASTAGAECRDERDHVPDDPSVREGEAG